MKFILRLTVECLIPEKNRIENQPIIDVKLFSTRVELCSKEPRGTIFESFFEQSHKMLAKRKIQILWETWLTRALTFLPNKILSAL